MENVVMNEWKSEITKLETFQVAEKEPSLKMNN